VVDIHLDPGGFGVSPLFPGSDLGEDGFLVVDAAVQALAAQDADFDSHHFQPAGMSRCVVKLNPLMLSRRRGWHSWSAISKSSYGKAARFVG